MPASRFIWNTLSTFYRLAKGITADLVILWVVLDSFALAFSVPICHRSLIYSGYMVEWRSLDWNVFSCNTFCTVAFIFDIFLDDIVETLTLAIMRLVMALMFYFWSTKFSSLSVPVRSGAPPWVITAPIFLEVSSSMLCEILGKRTLCGYHSCTNEQVTCGHV